MLGQPAPRWIQDPLVVRDRMEDPQEDPLAVHCFCVYHECAVADLDASRCMECDCLSVLSYPFL